MGRLLAIDYGKKRSGLAVTDPGRIIAGPLTTVATVDLEKFLIDYLDKEEVDAIVLGYPRTLDNKLSDSHKQLQPFINRLKKVFTNIDIHMVDERFTSSMARQAMIDGGMKKSDRRKKENVDKISASLILQSYMQQLDNIK